MDVIKVESCCHEGGLPDTISVYCILHGDEFMDINLLEILACPVCKGELVYAAADQELICKFDHLAYPVVDGIPVMLTSRARRIGMDE